MGECGGHLEIPVGQYLKAFGIRVRQNVGASAVCVGQNAKEFWAFLWDSMCRSFSDSRMRQCKGRLEIPAGQKLKTSFGFLWNRI